VSTDRFDLRSLLETSRLLSSSLEVDFVLNSLLLSAMSKLLALRGAVLLADPLAGGFRVEALKGRFPGGLARGDVLAVEAPEEPVEGEAIPEALRGLGVALLLPICYHDRAIGLVGLGPKATGAPFAEHERAFVDSLVHMSAAAVHNAWAVEELQQANEELGQKVQQLNTLFDLAQAFNRAPDVDRAAHQLALALMGQFLVRRFAVLLRPEGGGELEVAAGRAAGTLDADALARLVALRHLLLLDEDAPPEWGPLREQGFALALPIRTADATRGVLLLGPKGSGKPYDADEADFLTALGQLVLTAIESARGAEARRQNERLEEEMRLARSIQERLLPQGLPSVTGAALASLNLPSRYVAGDYYDAVALDADRVLLAVADVSGKGLPASLLAANLQACLHVLAGSLGTGTVSLAASTARVNRVIHRNTGFTTFITFCWGVYDRRSGDFRYVNAGHNPPLLLRAEGGHETLDAGGLLLGVLADAPYEEGTVTLGPGDLLTLYTDGVTEAWSATDPDDEFGEERLLSVLQTHRPEGAEAVLREVRSALGAHTGGGPLDDDLTILVLSRDPA
jgi:phosphoserine phosphatase RsbU/P